MGARVFFVEDREKNICLICRDTVASNKRGNLERHYNTKHGKDFTSIVGDARQIKLDQMKKSLVTEQSIFKKVDTSQKSVTAASYAISNIIAKRMKPFTDGEYIKECLTVFMDNCCPDKKDLAQQLSLSDTTVMRRVESISNDINEQLLERARDFTSFSIAID